MLVSDKIAVQQIIRLAKAYGISDVVLSPGSRNAPFIISLTNDSFFTCHQIVDERSAAFFALGIALKKKQPVIISCTSGSAALNYAPAILEAYNQGVPLLVITSDRPSNGYEIGEGQCFNQHNCFSNYINFETHIIEQEKNTEKTSFELLSNVFDHFNASNKGPVHINVAFNEPLYQMVESNNEHLVLDNNITDDNPNLTPLIKEWEEYKSKLIIVSQGAPIGITNILVELQEKDSSVYIIQENLSNTGHKKLNSSIDRTIKQLGETINHFTPELIVTIGSNIVSKIVKHQFRKHQPLAHWSFNNNLQQNVFELKANHFNWDVSLLLLELVDKKNINGSDYQNRWKQLNDKVIINHSKALKEVPFSDMKAFEVLLNELPSCDLHLGNSSVVRYAQLYNPREDITYFGNRGISGIDGCSSTAIGFSVNNDRLTTLITGDLSFFYDSNAFWNAYKTNVLIIVINNGGGSIFKIIDGPSSQPQAINYFTGEYTPSVHKFCELHELNYSLAKNEVQIREYLTNFKDNGIQVLEIDTSSIDNESVLKQYFKELTIG